MSAAARSGPPAFSQAASSPTPTMSPSTRTVPNSRAATDRLRRHWKCWFRRRMPARSVACRSRIRAAGCARSRSRPTRSSRWRPMQPISLIQPSPSCSSRPSTLPMSASSWRRGGVGARRAGDLGRASRCHRRRGRGQAGSRDRPGPFPRPWSRRAHADRDDRWTAALKHDRHGTRSRSLPCVAACASRPVRLRASPSGRSCASTRDAAARPRRQAP